MDPRGGRIPELSVGIDERVDFSGRQLEASFAQGCQRFTRLLDELQPQFFIRDDLTDEQLNRFLRHGADLTRRQGNSRATSSTPASGRMWAIGGRISMNGWTGAFEVSAQLWALCVDLRTPRRAGA
jgi:hypothetical protein